MKALKTINPIIRGEKVKIREHTYSFRSWVRDRMKRARWRINTISSRSFKAMHILKCAKVLFIQLESRWFRRVQGEVS